MNVKLKFAVKKQAWITNPARRWNYALERAGLVGWKGNLQKYPRKYGPDAGGYKRTGALGNKAAFRIQPTGLLLQLLGTFYTRFLLFGTGIWGPKAQPIRPVRAKFLAFPSTGRGHKKVASGVRRVRARIYTNKAGRVVDRPASFKADKSRDQYLVFAKQVRGTKWFGKLDEVVDAIKRAFESGVRSYREN